MIVGEFLQRNRIGFWTSQCSKMYSSVAKLNSMFVDSAVITSIAAPLSFVKNDGHGPLVVAKYAREKGRSFWRLAWANLGRNMFIWWLRFFIITRSVYYQVKFRQRLIKEQYFKQNEAGSLLTGHSFFFSEEIDDLDHCLLWCLLQCWNQGARLLVVFWHQVPDEDIVSVSDQFTFRVHILLIP